MITTQKDSKDKISKAKRSINSILRLMQAGAIQHEQARSELKALPKRIAEAEIEYCVMQAIRDVDIDQHRSQVKGQRSLIGLLGSW